MNASFKNLIKTNNNGLSLYVTTELVFGGVVVRFIVEVVNSVVNSKETFKDYIKALDYYDELDA